MRYIVRGLVIPLVVVAISVLFIEVGFGLRALSTDLLSSSTNQNVSTRVLLIGDSILGFKDEPGTIAGQFKRLVLESRKDVAFSEISRPGQTSSEVLRGLRARLQEFRPTVTVIMLGKSDYAAASNSSDWITNLRTYQLAKAALEDLRTRYSSAILLQPKTPANDLVFDPIWKKQKAKEYEELIPMLEAALNIHPDYENGIRLIYFTYLREKEFSRGEKFLTALAAKSKHADLAITLGTLLRYEFSQGDPQTRARVIADLEAYLAKSKDHRGALKAGLWLQKKNGDAKKFSRLLTGMQPANSHRLLNSTASNLRAIAEASLSFGSSVVVVQYPTDHIEVLQAVFHDRLDQVTFLEARKWITDGTSEEVMGNVDDDIEHVSGSGAELVATKLKAAIF